MSTLEGTPNPEAPNPQLPIVQKLRIRYAKRGRLRFTSHRDFARAFERAVRRAGVPIAFSSGYSPHPKISYANASPTGAATEAEYLEIGLTRECDPDAVRADLDASLPPGLDVLEVVVAAGQGSLADRLQASEWSIELAGRGRRGGVGGRRGLPRGGRRRGRAHDQAGAPHLRRPRRRAGPRSPSRATRATSRVRY